MSTEKEKKENATGDEPSRATNCYADWRDYLIEKPESDGYYLVFFKEEKEYGNPDVVDICYYTKRGDNWTMGTTACAEDGLDPDHWSPLPIAPVRGNNLLQLYSERYKPIDWAAQQILQGGRPDMTVGEAVDMIKQIINQAVSMILKKA